MQKLRVLLALLSGLPGAAIFAQCDTTLCNTPMAAESAIDACILPSSQALSCYVGGLYDYTPINIPGGCIDPQMAQWFAFVADSTLINFNVAALDCNGSNGIDAAILSTINCHTFQYVSAPFCKWIKPGEAFPVVASNLTVGQVYYLVISGHSGDLCEYSINNAPYVGGSPAGICIPYYNMNQLFTSSIPVEWTLIPPTAGAFVGTPTLQQALVNWLEPGPAAICATNTACPSEPHYCLNVNIGELKETFLEVGLCPNGTVLCEGFAYSTPGTYSHFYASEAGCDSIVYCKVVPIPPVPVTTETVNLCQGKTTTCAGTTFSAPGNYPVHLHTWRGCDSLVNCVVHLLPTAAPPIKPVEICASASYAVCNYVHDATGIYTDTCVGANWQGCDSIVKTDLAVLNPVSEIAPPDLLPCGTNPSLFLYGINAQPSTAPGAHTLYHWTGPGIVGAANQMSVKINTPGTYCLELSHERNGHSCSRTTCVDVEQDELGPSPPLLAGPTSVCPGDTGLYTAIAAGPVPTTGYLWTLPLGVPYTIVNSTNIVVHWPTVPDTAQVCVSAYNACDTSAPTCRTVFIHPFPHAMAVGGQVGCDTFPTLLHAQSVPSATYVWTGPGGFFSTAPSPEVISTGIYTLLLTDTLTGCSQADTALVTPCCHVSAGTFDTLPIHLCGPATATPFHHGNEVLEAGDTLRFILFADSLQPLMSILTWSFLPAFNFLPGITDWDSTYYIAAIAGQLMPNDSINLSDSCLALSRAVPVRWHRKPTMTLVPTLQAVCRVGCLTETFTFMGEPPFQFTWQVSQGGQVLLTRDEALNGGQKTIQVCPLEFAPPVVGAVDFRVLGFGDKWCTCMD